MPAHLPQTNNATEVYAVIQGTWPPSHAPDAMHDLQITPPPVFLVLCLKHKI